MKMALNSPHTKQVSAKTKWEKCSIALWNPSEKKFLGRTGMSWCKILTYFFVFHTSLIGLFAVCMAGLMATVNESAPKLQLERSLIGTNPGLGFRPLSDQAQDGSLIWYNSSNQTQVEKWVNLLDDFLEPYLVSSKNLSAADLNRTLCSFDRPPGHGEVCSVDTTSWSPCVSNESYGYDKSSPCFFLKLNKIYNWYPEFYDKPDELPADMPADLKTYIQKLPQKNRRQVWVSCEGEKELDREMLTQTGVRYIPERGFPEFYFPYINTRGYISPLVAIHFDKPPKNRLINIHCRAWAKNIHFLEEKSVQQGSVHFEIMLD